MKTFLTTLAIACALALPAAACGEHEIGQLEQITGLSPAGGAAAYAYATAPSQANGAVFMILAGLEAGDKLTGASTSAAEKAELHTMISEDGVMKMRPAESFEIGADGTLTLTPTEDHIMLVGLKNPLTEGQTFPLTLTFEKAGTRDIAVEVRAAGGDPMEHMHHH